MGLACDKIKNGTNFATWNGAGGGSTLTDQPFESWDFGWGGFRICKILSYVPNTKIPLKFELRNKEAYCYFATNFGEGIDGTEVGNGTAEKPGCPNILGTFGGGLAIDTSVTTAVGYTYSAGIFTKSSNPCTTPTISISVPNQGKFSIGENITLTADVQNATSYQWYKDGIALTGKIGILLTITNATAADAGKYYCKAVNNCGGGFDSTQKDSNELTLVNVVVVTRVSRFYAKIENPCTSAIAQFGYTQTPSTNPTIWLDAEGVVRAKADINGDTVEVETGGDIYQYKQYDLPLGDYYFYIRQKDNPTNILYIGVITVQ